MNDSLSHIAFFLPSLRGGGAERVILDIAREAAEHVPRVDLVLVERTGVYTAENPGRLNIIDLNASRCITSIPKLAQFLGRECPQALVSALPHANIAAIIAGSISRTSTRVIVSEHSIMSRHQRPSLKVAMLLRAMRLLYPRADQAIAISDPVRDAMIQGAGIPPSRGHMIYNPIDLERIRGQCDEGATHPWLSNKTTPIIITAGRLVEEKDHESLIRALTTLGRKETRLIIFGEGPLRAKLEALRDELGLKYRVDLPGFISNPYAEFAQADVFVLPSKSEGFANVVIESLACGTPVIATRANGGIADSIEDGKAVRLVDIGDYRGMGVAIDACIGIFPEPFCMESIVARFSLEIGWEGYKKVVLTSLEESRR